DSRGEVLRKKWESSVPAPSLLNRCQHRLVLQLAVVANAIDEEGRGSSHAALLTAEHIFAHARGEALAPQVRLELVNLHTCAQCELREVRLGELVLVIVKL